MGQARASGTLPLEVSSFVGRRRELAEIRRLLGATRLLTLTGTGGAGKSRLALRAASELRRSYEAVHLVELASVSDPAAVVEAAARVVGMRDQSGRWPIGSLVDFVGDRRILLLLDNCEHLVEPCAVLVDALLRGCPGLAVLATSRQPLGIDGETAMRVPSLAVPDSGTAVSAETLPGYEAATLFVERAAAVQPGFELTDDNARAVARLCRELDGIPLAIELAAGRLGVLSVEEIVSRLDDRLRLLSGGSRSGLPRHRTLRAAIEWSADLLEEAEQVLWRRLAVFPGSFDLATAETVCSGDGLPADAVLEALSGLVAKSIVVRGATSGGSRFHLLATLRAYGAEMLDTAGERAATCERLAAWVESLVAGFSAGWWSAEQAAWLDRLATEEPSIRAVLGELVRSGAGERGLRLVTGMWQYGETRGYLRETRRLLDAFLPTCTQATPLRARGLWLAGYFARNEGDHAVALAALDESARMAETLQDRADLGCARLYRGLVVLDQGDVAGSGEELRAAIALLRGAGEPHHLGFACHCLASVHRYLGDIPAAREMEEEALAVSAAAGELWVRAHALTTMGLLELADGDARSAERMQRESVRLRRRLDHRWGLLLVVETLTWTAAVTARWERTATLLGIVDALAASLRVERPPHTRTDNQDAVDRVTAALGAAEVRRLREQGRALPLDRALAFVLEEDTQQPARRSGRATAASGPAPDQLTRREREIAELVAAGLSNKQIAHRLFISDRTADTHVQNVLGKLGFSSRVQIAAWVAERRGAGVAP